MIVHRKTLAEAIVFEGLGLHSGVPVVATVHPGGAGIWFRCGSERVEAIPANVSDTRRCTRLGGIATIEHLMSALAGSEFTDAEVELTAPELPAMDGSALPFWTDLSAAAKAELGEVEKPDLFTRVFAQEGGASIGIALGTGRGRYEFQSDRDWPYEQSFETEDMLRDYGSQIAPARTTAFHHEIEMARQAGLGRGLDESSVLVLGPSGCVNAARFENELPRHKLLDLMGDLYLAGVPMRTLSIVGQRSGHRLNVEAASRLAAAMARP